MFRPNIRGVPRQELRPGLSGWRLKGEPTKVIAYLLPWRKNWVNQIHRKPSLDVVLSRSGKVHILVKPARIQNFKSKLFYAALAGAAALGAFAFANNSAAELDTKIQIESAGSSGGGASCEQLMLNPEKFLGENPDAVLGSVQLKVSSSQELGGVKSKVVTISCGAQSSTYRVTYVMQKDSWKIKKWARLEN